MQLRKYGIALGILVAFAALLGLYLSLYKPPTFQDALQPVQKAYAWIEATSSAPWNKRDSAASFVFHDRLFLTGGLDGDLETNSSHFVKYWETPHFNDIWYTDDGSNWQESSTTAPWPPRRSMTVIEYNGTLWMFGGWSPIGAYTSDLWNSSDGLTWKKVGTVPWKPREGQLAEVFNGRLYVMGGVNYDDRQEKNDVWYTEDGLHWIEALEHAPWSPRWDHAIAVFNGSLYLTGGMDLKKNTYGDAWVTQDGVNWQELPTPPWPTRQGHVLLPFQNKLWLIGRLNDVENGGINDAWVSSDGIQWESAGELPWIGREDFNAAVFKDAIWIFAGMGADWKWKNDVWAFKESR